MLELCQAQTDLAVTGPRLQLGYLAKEMEMWELGMKHSIVHRAEVQGIFFEF